MCLVIFVAWFNCVKDKDSDESTNGSTSETSDDFLLETELNDNVDDDPSAEDNQTDDGTEYKLKGGIKSLSKGKEQR